jgi:trk system potassium uptake protein TrkH
LLLVDSMSFTDAFFETMSGLTTTGSTIMTDLDHAPPAINLWRHELNWLGGMGIIVLAVAVLPLLGVGGMRLYKAETPGPMKDSKLTARIADTAKALWLVYFLITVVCILLLNWAGLSWLDSICHAFAAMGLGGFDPRRQRRRLRQPGGRVHPDRLHGDCRNELRHPLRGLARARPARLLAGRGSPRRGRADRRLVLWRGALRVAGRHLRGLPHRPPPRQLQPRLDGHRLRFRQSGFRQVAGLRALWMLFLSCITASSGSTGGGIKMIRTLILAKQANRELTRLIHPAVVNPVKVGGGRSQQRGHRRPRLHLPVFHQRGDAHLRDDPVGAGFHERPGAVVASINNAGPVSTRSVRPPTTRCSPISRPGCAASRCCSAVWRLSLAVVFTPQFWRK